MLNSIYIQTILIERTCMKTTGGVLFIHCRCLAARLFFLDINFFAVPGSSVDGEPSSFFKTSLEISIAGAFELWTIHKHGRFGAGYARLYSGIDPGLPTCLFYLNY